MTIVMVLQANYMSCHQLIYQRGSEDYGMSSRRYRRTCSGKHHADLAKGMGLSIAWRGAGSPEHVMSES